MLVLVLSTERQFYKKLMDTSLDTWDLFNVEGVETIFYCGESVNPSTDKILYTPVNDIFHNMGYKTIEAFDFALKNKQFDYVFRANASLYVNKERLLKYVQNKPETNLALGVCGMHNDEPYLWGPGYLLSKDVVQLIVDNRKKWNNTHMDDVAVSMLLRELGIALDNRGHLASIAIKDNGYEIVYYHSGVTAGCHIYELQELKTLYDLQRQFAFRVKDDANRENDVRLMNELYKVFNDV